MLDDCRPTDRRKDASLSSYRGTVALPDALSVKS